MPKPNFTKFTSQSHNQTPKHILGGKATRLQELPSVAVGWTYQWPLEGGYCQPQPWRKFGEQAHSFAPTPPSLNAPSPLSDACSLLPLLAMKQWLAMPYPWNLVGLSIIIAKGKTHQCTETQSLTHVPTIHNLEFLALNVTENSIKENW